MFKVYARFFKTGEEINKEFEVFEEAKEFYNSIFYKAETAELTEGDKLIYLWNNDF
jgi:hypothetical protein